MNVRRTTLPTHELEKQPKKAVCELCTDGHVLLFLQTWLNWHILLLLWGWHYFLAVDDAYGHFLVVGLPYSVTDQSPLQPLTNTRVCHSLDSAPTRQGISVMSAQFVNMNQITVSPKLLSSNIIWVGLRKAHLLKCFYNINLIYLDLLTQMISKRPSRHMCFHLKMIPVTDAKCSDVIIFTIQQPLLIRTISKTSHLYKAWGYILLQICNLICCYKELWWSRTDKTKARISSHTHIFD